MSNSLEIAEKLLRAARCPDPNCDGFGTTVHMASGVTAGCCGQPLGDGQCCGNAIAVQTQDIEPAPCQWCHERAELLGDASLLAPPAQPEAKMKQGATEDNASLMGMHWKEREKKWLT